MGFDHAGHVLPVIAIGAVTFLRALRSAAPLAQAAPWMAWIDDIAEIETALTRLAGVRALVVGDVILDRYLTGEVARISPEAPVPVLKRSGGSAALGGAGNVARHFTAYGGSAVLVGLVGVDDAAGELRRLAEAEGLTVDLVVDPSRPTTVKTRVLAQGQQMLRIDEEAAHPAEGAMRAQLRAAVARRLADCDVVVVSDYAKGVLTGGIAAELVALGRAAGKPVFVDPKLADFDAYRGASVVSPNAKELAEAVGLRAGDDASAEAACRLALERFSIDAILLTRSEKGMTLLERGAAAPVHVPAQALKVFDVSGAGDTSIATLAAGVATGLPLAAAMRLANAAAGVVVGKPGTALPTLIELRHALGLDNLHRPVGRAEAAALAEAWRREGKRIGFTNGVFDLLHGGHLQSLEQASRRCDALVVGVNADASVRRLKGPARPIQDETTRARVLACLDFCDLVVVFEEDTPAELIAAIQPDILFKGADYRADQVVGADIVTARGGEVVLLPLVPDTSTTATVARIRAAGPAKS
jgi:D-beta-D-heptose 7-phosphate kinase/D-beta-D-heptose 1-phosphate adenosyltransferase